MKLPPYVRCHCFQEKWQLLDFQLCVESVALISSQPSDGWLGSASYYIFEVGKLLDLFLLYYWQGRSWHVLIAIQVFAYRDFPEQNHYTFLCNLQVFVQAFFSYYCSTILSREWWFSCTNNYTMLVSTLWDFYTSSFTPVFMQVSRPSLTWTWIQFWSMMKRYKIHSLMTPGNIRTQVERWRKTWDCSKR